MGRKKTNSESEQDTATKPMTDTDDKKVDFGELFVEKKPEEKKELLKDNEETKKGIKKEMSLDDVLTKDDKLLFSLNLIGSVKVNEKLIEKDDLISIDDRWFFQNIRRWWSDDNRDKSSNKILIIISDTEKRLLSLLEGYYKPIKMEYNNNKFKENNEKKRLINKYFLALHGAKLGLENCRDTYPDQFTKNKYSLSIQKTEDLLNKLQNYDRD